MVAHGVPQYFRPQTISVSQLFLQIIAYLLGKVLDTFIPGAGAPGKLKTGNSWLARFMNPGPFSTLARLGFQDPH
jgi:hypothetical protein